MTDESRGPRLPPRIPRPVPRGISAAFGPPTSRASEAPQAASSAPGPWAFGPGHSQERKCGCQDHHPQHSGTQELIDPELPDQSQ